ncbi:MAG TPA: phage holin family protein [Xanthobacteraceae bacterium]|nr:phage holin family protein [Xanthobacteraceae bacterium]
MFEDLVQNLHLLRKADSLIARIWLHVIARRFGLFVFAGLIAVFGLGMANVAGFYALQASVGPVWAAAIVAVVDFVLAAIVAVAGKNCKPGDEIELALEIRRMAIDSIKADARDLKVSIDALGQEVRDIKNSVAGFVRNPLDAAAQRLLIPAAVSIIRGLRPKKEQS